jgi:hypothetical protein
MATGTVTEQRIVEGKFSVRSGAVDPKWFWNAIARVKGIFDIRIELTAMGCFRHRDKGLSIWLGLCLNSGTFRISLSVLPLWITLYDESPRVQLQNCRFSTGGRAAIRIGSDVFPNGGA